MSQTMAARSICGREEGGGDGGAVDIRGRGVVQNRESPYFRSSEVGRYVSVSHNVPSLYF